jgi:orotidine-5'-phosphate decarboxylase
MGSPIIVALDMDQKSALELANKIDPQDCKVKVGSQLFTSSGPNVIKELKNLGFEIFLDLKFHDIPNTVRKSVETAIEMGVWMLNIHSLGGKEMLKAAYEAKEKALIKPLLLGVTILTSLDSQSIKEVGLKLKIEDQVLLLTNLCKEEGLDGVVCSPNELALLRKNVKKDFLLVTPGIRSLEVQKHDQKRTSTFTEAIEKGADYVVIGRDITTHRDPNKKIKEILETV